MATIRAEQPSDVEGIRRLHVAAFGGEGEADLVDALRAADAVALSLVADWRGEVVGHVMLSPVGLDGEGPDVLALAPLAVRPTHQRFGIGSSLVREALLLAVDAGAGAVVVLGEPGFYARFGFFPALAYDIQSHFTDDPEALQVVEVVEGGLIGRSGTVRYHEAFAPFAPARTDDESAGFGVTP